jgi:hypothetical protein
MTVELHISFKNPDRERVQQPFLFHQTPIDLWLPLAEQLGLPMLERTGVLMIHTEDEARRLLAELRAVQQFIRRTRREIGPDRGGRLALVSTTSRSSMKPIGPRPWP